MQMGSRGSSAITRHAHHIAIEHGIYLLVICLQVQSAKRTGEFGTGEFGCRVLIINTT